MSLNISVFHGYMGQLLDYIILEMPLATFDTGTAEIFTINFVPPFITNKTSWIESVPRYFFLFGQNFIEEPEELGDVMHVLSEFPYWPGAIFFSLQDGMSIIQAT